MASITDCVVEGLKYPFRDVKKLLGVGVLFALLSALSTYAGFRSFGIFRASVHIAEANNTGITHVPFSQLPAGDIYLVAVLAVLSLIISLVIMGYQYKVVKFSIDKADELPGFDFPAILVDGVKYFIAALAYNAVPSIVLMVGMALAGQSSAWPVIIAISGILYIIANLLLIMALNNMIAHDSLKKAFDFSEIMANVSNLGWGKYVGIVIFTAIVMMIISVAVSFVLSLFSVIFAATINNQALTVSMAIAIIGGLFIDSYMSVFFSRVCGLIYRESIK